MKIDDTSGKNDEKVGEKNQSSLAPLLFFKSDTFCQEFITELDTTSVATLPDMQDNRKLRVFTSPLMSQNGE